MSSFETNLGIIVGSHLNDAKYDEVCTDAVKAACDEFGVTA